MSFGYSGWFLMAIAWVVEVLGWAVFLQYKEKQEAFIFYYVLHGLAALPLYLIIYLKIHSRYEGQQLWLYLFVSLLLVIVPFVSVFGVSIGFVLATLFPYEKKRQEAWDSVSIPALPYRPLSMKTNFSFVSLRQILDAALDTEKRLQAIFLSRQLPEKGRIRLLQLALKDSDDEVRLLAYSMLEDREKEISEKIIKLQRDLSNQLTGDDRGQVLFSLAQSFWDMAYLGIAQKDLKRYFLGEARKYLSMLLDEKDSGPPWFLLGRVELHVGQYESAEKAFKRAIQLGVSEREVLPWLAEAAFHQAHYLDLIQFLRRYSSHGQVIAPLRPVVQYWLGCVKSEV